MPFFKWIFIFLNIVCFTGCTSKILTVREEGVTARSYASYYVETSDLPQTARLPKGERLHIFWSFPKSFSFDDSYTLIATIRFWDHVQSIHKEIITTPRGHIVYSLLDEDFYFSKGIQTYHIELLQGSQVIATQKHLLWTNWIDIGENQSK